MSSSSSSTHNREQDNNGNTQSPQYSLVSRIWGYPFVHYAADTAGEYYNYVKSYNSYSKKVFDVAESYATPIVSASLTKLDELSHKPLVEGMVVRADTFGCQQLDRIEEGIHKIKEVPPIALKNMENAIHGSKVEKLLIKTVGVLDNVVDALLPQEGDEDTQVSHDDEEEENGDMLTVEYEEGESADGDENVTIMTATAPVLRKLRTRVSKKSVLRLPIRTYSGLKSLATRNKDSLPHLADQYVKMLRSASSYILATKQATQQKGTELSTVSVDYIYLSLHRVSSSVSSLVSLVKKLDPIEARASVSELANMISTSKQNFSKVIDNVYSTQKLKEDSSAILLRAGEALSRPFEAGYTRVANSDIAAIKDAFNSLEAAVQGIIESFSIQAEQDDE